MIKDIGTELILHKKEFMKLLLRLINEIVIGLEKVSLEDTDNLIKVFSKGYCLNGNCFYVDDTSNNSVTMGNCIDLSVDYIFFDFKFVEEYFNEPNEIGLYKYNPEYMINEFVNVKIVDSDEYDLFGEFVE